MPTTKRVEASHQERAIVAPRDERATRDQLHHRPPIHRISASSDKIRRIPSEVILTRARNHSGPHLKFRLKVSDSNFHIHVFFCNIYLLEEVGMLLYKKMAN
jgi:hypothetical protein